VPGNLEANPILAATKGRNNRKPLAHNDSWPPPSRPRAAEGRRSEPLTSASATRPTQPTIDRGAGPAGALPSPDSGNHPIGKNVLMDSTEASRTSLLVCQGRAVAHGRIAVGRFDDPTAWEMLHDDERRAVEGVRAGPPPKQWSSRVEYEMLRASGEVMVPRTVAIDDAIREGGAQPVVILGAGLDGRAWRMPELAGVEVFEVDHPASQTDKRHRVAGLIPTANALRFVPVDFTRDDLGAALAGAGHDQTAATTWIWEGVVPYLTRGQVEATMRSVSTRSAPGSRLVVNYQAPSTVAALGRLAARAMSWTARRRDPLAKEPRRSAWRPAEMAELLASQGFVVRHDRDLLTVAGGLGVEIRNHRSVGTGRVAVADR